MANLMTNDLQIQFVDPADCIAIEDADPATRPEIEFLRESLEHDGQNVPVLLYPHPEKPGKYAIIDGIGRCHCLRQLGCTVKAFVLPRQPSKIERIELKFSHNVLRRSLSMGEIAADASEYIELTGCHQKDAAKRLKCSDATISNALSLIRRIPPECRAQADQLGHSFISLVASLRDADAVRKALDYASTPQANGKKPSRDQVARYVAELKGKKPAKVKRFRFPCEGRLIDVDLRSDDSAESLIKAFKAAMDRIAEHRKLSLDAIVAELGVKGGKAAAKQAKAS